MDTASRDEPIKRRYVVACTSLVEAIYLAKEGGRGEWIYGTSVEKLSSVCRAFLSLHPHLPSSLSLDSYPLMLTALMLFSRRFGTEPYDLCQANSDAVSQTACALRERLEALSSRVSDLDPGLLNIEPDAYRAQYRGFQDLLVLEEKFANIDGRLMQEMMRRYPSAPLLLGTVLDLRRLMDGVVVPFWVIDV